MASLTIIIPFLKNMETELLEETLVSVLANRPKDCDIIVVNAADYEDHWQIWEEGVVFCMADSDTGLMEAINIGIQNAQAPVVHIILCGCQVKEGWTQKAVVRFEQSNVAAVVPIVEVAGGQSAPNAIRGTAYTRDGVILPLAGGKTQPPHSFLAPTVMGAFFRTDTLVDIGGFDTSLDPRFSFVDTALLLEAIKRKTVYEGESALSYETCPLLEPTLAERITAQETIFQRWVEFKGGVFLSKGAHRFRKWKEGLAALFNGTSSLVQNAYKVGAMKSAAGDRKKLVETATSNILARSKAANQPEPH